MITTLSDALAERGFDTLTAVQTAVTAPELAEADLLVSAQTGSGKTVGFGLAIAPTLLDADGRVRRRFASSQLPLGVVESTREGCEPEQCALVAGEQFALFSDGVVEVAGDSGEPFGIERFEETLASHAVDQRVEAVRQALAGHLEGASAHDDMSLLLLDAAALDGHAALHDPVI